MNFIDAIKDYISDSIEGTSLEGFATLVPGGSDNYDPPFIGITEESNSMFEQAGVIVPGVHTYELSVDLVTVPGDTVQDAVDGPSYDDQRADFWNIVGDRGMIAWADGREQWRIFDIRPTAPIMMPDDGLRVVRVNLTVIACQL